MKLNIPHPAGQQHSKRGIALVITLLLLVLLSAFAVAFFSRMTVEQSSANSYADGITTRQLAESAVGAVMGQIREATTVPNGAWATQPGMVRVFGGSTAASPGNLSAPYGYYKLYSAENMVVTGAGLTNYNPSTDVPDETWKDQPAAWVDLNEPVRIRYNDAGGSEQTAMRYPILDPELAVVSSGTGANAHDSANHRVEGFSSDKTDSAGKPDVRMPVRWLYVLRDGTLTSPTGIGSDGKSVNWDGGGSDPLKTPSKDNPIVGRVAFWADDDTNKVNINTAAGFTDRDVEKTNKFGAKYDYDGPKQNYAGSYWDVPRFFTLFDRGGATSSDQYPNDGVFRAGSLSLSQPPRNEFQRYPGHPATTSLGLLFRDISTKTPRLTSEMLYNLLPRVTPGGTEGGTNRLIAQGVMSGGRLGGGTSTGGGGDFRMDQVMNQKAERLYSSVDEFFFAAKQNGSGTGATRMTSNAYVKQLEADAPELVRPEEIDGFRFFLTAHSRAPELNLYGRPRISMWPVDTTTAKQNHTDRLIRFCSTLWTGPQDSTDLNKNARGFYFQRTDPYAYDTIDITLKRNQDLLTYLQTLTNRTVPGYSSSFSKKYPGTDDGSRDQILTEMFDYIRVANLRDGTNDKINDTQVEVDDRKYAPRGVVVPSSFTKSGSTPSYGFGRFPVISEIALVLYHSGYQPYDPKNGAYYLDPREKQSKGVKGNLFRAFLATETYNPMQGYAQVSSFTEGAGVSTDQAKKNFITYRLDFDPWVAVNGGTRRPLNFKDKINEVYKSSGSAQAGRASAGMEGFAHTMYSKFWSMDEGVAGSIINSVQSNYPTYPFQSLQDIDIPVNPLQPNRQNFVTISDAGGGDAKGSIVISFKGRDLQVINFTFPVVTVPAPTDAFWWDAGGLAWSSLSDFSGSNRLNMGSNWGSQKSHPGWAKRLGNRIFLVQSQPPANSSTTLWNVRDSGDGLNYGNRWKQLLQPGDTIRSVIPGPASSTDMRTIALTPAKEPLQYGIVNSVSYYDQTLRHTRESLEILKSGPTGGIADTTNTLRTGSGAVYMSGIAAESVATGSGANLTWGWQSKVYSPTFGNLVQMNANPGAYAADKAADLPAVSDVNGVPKKVDGVFTKDGKPGDFDTGIGNLPDGPYCNKPDEGNMRWRHWDTSKADWTYDYPYFQSSWLTDSALDTFFAPNRQMPSPVMFGSLLVGRKANWQTLCFSPNPIGAYNPGGNGTHRGKDVEPKDHLLLDLFTMPIVEPYAISEPFSTAGKINLNAQIAPFSYIHRTTALRAALHSVRVTAVPAADVKVYKTGSPANVPLDKNYRYILDRDETVKGIMSVFDDPAASNPKFYRSASEICERFLYPKVPNGTSPKWSSNESAIKTFWQQNTLAGDNVREKPYADLYPRLTTKSNSFTVHVRVQKLRPMRGGAKVNYAEWIERDDAIASEYRGETQIERYLDPNDRRFDNQQTTSADLIDVEKQTLEPAYRFRVVHSKRFSPDR